MAVPGFKTFDASPVGVRCASAGGAATSGGAGIEGVAAADVVDAVSVFLLVQPAIAMTISHGSRIGLVRVSMFNIV